MPMQSPESASDIKFEIGHVLFIDIVGYSKLLITEQSDQFQKLKQIVRGTEQFRICGSGRQTSSLTDWRWWRTRLSHYSGSTGVVRARDKRGT